MKIKYIFGFVVLYVFLILFVNCKEKNLHFAPETSQAPAQKVTTPLAANIIWQFATYIPGQNDRALFLSYPYKDSVDFILTGIHNGIKLHAAYFKPSKTTATVTYGYWLNSCSNCYDCYYGDYSGNNYRQRNSDNCFWATDTVTVKVAFNGMTSPDSIRIPLIH